MSNIRKSRKGWRPLDPPGDMPDATWSQDIKLKPLEVLDKRAQGYKHSYLPLQNAQPKKPHESHFWGR